MNGPLSWLRGLSDTGRLLLATVVVVLVAVGFVVTFREPETVRSADAPRHEQRWEQLGIVPDDAPSVETRDLQCRAFAAQARQLVVAAPTPDDQQHADDLKTRLAESCDPTFADPVIASLDGWMSAPPPTN